MTITQLTVTFKGAVLSLYCAVEGREVVLVFDGKETWSRVLANVKVEGALDVLCIAKGFSGIGCELTVQYDGASKSDTQPMPRKGILVFQMSLPLPKSTESARG